MRKHRFNVSVWAVAATLSLAATVSSASAPVVDSIAEPAPFTIVENAIAEPLQGRIGDAARGRAIVASRQIGLCLLCHAAPIAEERFQGNLSVDLAGIGIRATAGQLRMRLVDARKLNPATIMPSYYRADNLTRVTPAQQGRTIFSAQQIEDVVAYLQTLRDDQPGAVSSTINGLTSITADGESPIAIGSKTSQAKSGMATEKTPR